MEKSGENRRYSATQSTTLSSVATLRTYTHRWMDRRTDGSTERTTDERTGTHIPMTLVGWLVGSLWSARRDGSRQAGRQAGTQSSSFFLAGPPASSLVCSVRFVLPSNTQNSSSSGRRQTGPNSLKSYETTEIPATAFDHRNTVQC